MNYNIKIGPEANIEINEALEYYNKINNELSAELFNTIFDSLNFIQNKPYSFTTKYKNIRGLSIDKYPYIIYYFIDEVSNTIIIISVFNTNQNPDKWHNRI